MEKIINETLAAQMQLEKSIRDFLPLNQSKFWIETNNAQREIIHKDFIELKKVIARLMILIDFENNPAPEKLQVDWSKDFLK